MSVRRRRADPYSPYADWRDPSMPVTGRKGEAIPPLTMQLFSQYKMDKSSAPNWRYDPTYDLTKRDKKR